LAPPWLETLKRLSLDDFAPAFDISWQMHQAFHMTLFKQEFIPHTPCVGLRPSDMDANPLKSKFFSKVIASLIQEWGSCILLAHWTTSQPFAIKWILQS
jgi:hypothetical protein